MRVLSLFSGIGFHDLGLEWAGFEIAGQVEIDEYCQKILERHWPQVPKWRDVKQLSDVDIRSLDVDLVTGGFPCQDISVAGKGAGLDGARSGLWWEMRRIIAAAEPPWVLAENVPALRLRGGDEVIASLEELGYEVWPCVVGAVHAGAPHRRQRVWLVAHNVRFWQQRRERQGERLVRTGYGSEPRREDEGRQGAPESVANTTGERRWCAGKDGTEAPEPRGSGTDVAHTQCYGWGAWYGEPRDQASARLWWHQPKYCRAGLEHTTGEGLEGWWQRLPRFPSRPGEPQYNWEPPRTVESGVGALSHGSARRLALKAVGNANPPAMAATMGRAIMHLDGILRESMENP